MSGSSSTNNLMRNDVAKKFMYELKEMQAKYTQLEKDHGKLQKKYDRLLAQANQMK